MTDLYVVWIDVYDVENVSDDNYFYGDAERVARNTVNYLKPYYAKAEFLEEYLKNAVVLSHKNVAERIDFELGESHFTIFFMKD